MPQVQKFLSLSFRMQMGVSDQAFCLICLIMMIQEPRLLVFSASNNPYDKSCKTFSLKGQTVNILGFLGYTVPGNSSIP